MTTYQLLDQTFTRTLDDWQRRLAGSEWNGALVEGWLFEDQGARRLAEQTLAAAGVQARLRSAYKPLVHWFLEEVDKASLTAVSVAYPVHPQASAQRFLQEAYPLAAMLPDCLLDFVPGTDDLHYQLTLTHKDGSLTRASVWAPNRVHTDRQGVAMLSPTGWLRVVEPGASSPRIDAAQQTDYERLFEQVLTTVAQHPWPAQEPYFERLDIRVDLAGIERPLAVGHECISTAEALHEDIYFSLLEIFQHRSGRSAHDRRLQPGQIVPDLRTSQGAPRLCITLSDFDIAAQEERAAKRPSTDGPLALWGSGPSPARIAAEMDRLGGQRFRATSRQGRRVQGLYRPGAGAAVLISGGQHANETSGIVGALRAGQALKAQPESHFALIALENPDGYALQRELQAHYPGHMAHAARYSALGDDIEYREQPPLFERAARQQALALSGAQLHVNLHGYPAHEWTRPLSGYVPRGFELWTIPKGFFLILRYQPGWQVEAQALLEAVSAALAEQPELMAHNARQMALYERHAGALPFNVLHGTAHTLSEVDRPGAAVTLITEFPDETVADEAFRLAHSVQMHTALAAVQAWQTLARPA